MTNVIAIVVVIIINVILIDYICVFFFEFVFEHVISNCNRLHLWCNRPTSGTKLNLFGRNHECTIQFFNKTTFLQTFSLLYLATECINLSCCSSIVL